MSRRAVRAHLAQHATARLLSVVCYVAAPVALILGGKGAALSLVLAGVVFGWARPGPRPGLDRFTGRAN